MTRPRIYGSEDKCRAALARFIGRGDELLDQAIGVRKIMDEAVPGITPVVETEWMAHAVTTVAEAAWVKDFRKWMAQVGKGMYPFLVDQMYAVVPVIAHGLPPDTGKPRHMIYLENGEPWLRKAVEQLREVQDALGVRRDVAKTAPAPARFEELHASGLVDARVIDDQAKAMLAPRTPRQLHTAIGSAKELTEATLRAALDRLGEPYSARDELPVLMKTWRRAIGHLAPPDPQGADALDKAQAAVANLVTFLAEWRNRYGTPCSDSRRG
jgi:hypothetical protein